MLKFNDTYTYCRAIAVALLLPIAAMMRGQTERPDSVSMTVSPADSVPSYMLPAEYPEMPYRAEPRWEYSPEYIEAISAVRSSMSMPPIKSVRVDVPGVANVASWQDGGITAQGSCSSLYGMAGVESGSVNLSQSFGPVTVNAYVSADKMGYFRGLRTSYGIGGSVDYRINDRWSVTVFGAYYTGSMPLTPGMAGFANAPVIGGYASYNINDHWGISVGAKTTRSLVTNRWETQPIVMPYYRVNDKVSIGADVGGIIYGLIRSYIDSRDNGHGWGSPVIAPPRSGPPPVAPRR